MRIRVVPTASKRETEEILAECFDRRWSLITIYRHLKTALTANLKDTFQQALIRFAGDELKDNLRLVFYDVTTLYFETAAKVGLKNFGALNDRSRENRQTL